MSKKNHRDLKVITKDLHIALKREAANFIAIGGLLVEAQDQLDHGAWLPWLDENFGASVSTAENYMAAARFVAKFPTVANFKLRPTALYLLGRGLDQFRQFDDEVIEAVFSEAKTKWVTEDRVRFIWASLQPRQPRKTLDEIEAEMAAEEAAQKAETQAEVDGILDGPPPDLPLAPEATTSDVILPSFDQAIKALAQLRTKPLEKFIGTAHGADDIREIADFLQHVANAIDEHCVEPVGSPATIPDDLSIPTFMRRTV
jgi:hypothetical protein